MIWSEARGHLLSVLGLTRNSLMAVESPFGMGWKTARQRQVPMMAIRMKASNDFHSTTSSNFFLIGFLSPIHQRAYGSLSMGGLAPTLLAVFFTSAGGSPLATGGSPLGWPGSFPVPLCGESSMLTLSSVAPEHETVIKMSVPAWNISTSDFCSPANSSNVSTDMPHMTINHWFCRGVPKHRGTFETFFHYIFLLEIFPVPPGSAGAGRARSDQ